MATAFARVRRGVVAMFAVLVVLAPAIEGQGGTATGTLTVDTMKVALASATAVGYRASAGPLVSLLLSDKPPDAKSFAEDTTIGAGETYVPGIITGAWAGQHFTKRFSGVAFTITADGKLLIDQILLGGKNNTFGIGNDEYVLELTSKSPKIAGRIRTKTPVVDVGKKVGLDVTFDAPVTMIGK